MTSLKKDAKRGSPQTNAEDIRKELVLIPPRNLTITKERPLQLNSHKNEEATLKQHTELKRRLPFKPVVNSKKPIFRHDEGHLPSNSKVCQTGKERVVDAKVMLLTPKSMSKVRGTKFQSEGKQGLPAGVNEVVATSYFKAIGTKRNFSKERHADSNYLQGTELLNGNASDLNNSSLILAPIPNSSASLNKLAEFSIDNNNGLTSCASDNLDEEIQSLDSANTSMNFGPLSLYEVAQHNQNDREMFADDASHISSSGSSISEIYQDNLFHTTTEYNSSAGIFGANNMQKVVKLSPSLSLPITAIDQDFLQHKGVYQIDSVVSEPQVPFVLKNSSYSSVVSVSDDVETFSVSSDISNFTCSSLSMDQDGLILSDMHSTGNTFQTRLQDPDLLKQYKKEIFELKQSLKLAEADTVILVSSKQQLQLEQHDLSETNKILRGQLDKAVDDANEDVKNFAVLAKNKLITEEKHASEIRVLEKTVENTKARLKDISERLEATQLEKDRFKNEHGDVTRSLESFQSKNANLQSKIDELLQQNLKLDTLLQQASDDNSGNYDYIKMIRQERDEYARKVHERDQEIMNKQLEIQLLEERFAQFNKANLNLTTERDQMLSAIKLKDTTIITLQAQVALKSDEKKALDGAVSRLYDNLFKVEESFTKIKRDVAQKSRVANREGALKSQMELQLSHLQEKLKQLQADSLPLQQRISDKNNQIAQLLSQLRSNNTEKSKMSKEIANLKAYISQNEETWVKAVQKESNTSRLLDEKTAALSSSQNACAESAKMLEGLQVKKNEAEQLAIEHSQQVTSLQSDLKRLLQEKKDAEGLLSVRTSALNQLASEMEDQRGDKQNLERKFEELQMELLKHEKFPGSNSSDSQHHNDMIAELQTSRRTLQKELTRLEIAMKREKDKCLEIETSKVLLEKKNRELEVEVESRARLETEAKDLEQRLNVLMSLHDEAKQHNFSLKGESETSLKKLEVALLENNQLQETMVAKSKEISLLSKRNENLSEELQTVKEEMNLSTLRLLDELNGRENATDIKSRLEVSEIERNKLWTALEQQQRYVIALQTHYQEWAKDAASRLQQQQLRKKDSIELCDSETQTNHDDKPLHRSSVNHAFMQTDHEDKSNVGFSFQMEQNALQSRFLSNVLHDVPVQSRDLVVDDDTGYVSRDLLDPDSSNLGTCLNCRNRIKLGEEFDKFTQTSTVTDECSSETALFSRKFEVVSCQTEDGKKPLETELNVMKVPPPTTCSSAQTDHNSALVGTNTYSNFFQVPSSSAKTPACLRHVSVQTELDEANELATKPEATPVCWTEVTESSTQTEHDTEPVCSTFHKLHLHTGPKRVACVQTDHFYPEQVLYVSSSSQTEATLVDTADESDKLLVTTTDFSTQTDHDSERLLPNSYKQESSFTSFKKSSSVSQTDHTVIYECSSFTATQDSFTQTDYRDEFVTSSTSSLCSNVEPLIKQTSDLTTQSCHDLSAPPFLYPDESDQSVSLEILNVVSSSVQTELFCPTIRYPTAVSSQTNDATHSVNTQAEQYLSEKRNVDTFNSSTQTEHDFVPVGHVSGADCLHMLSRDDITITADACAQTKAAQARLKADMSDSFCQTDQHGGADTTDFVLQTCDLSTQTDHNLELITLTHSELVVSCDETGVQTDHGERYCDDISSSNSNIFYAIESIVCKNCKSAVKAYLSASYDVAAPQISMQNGTELADKNCQTDTSCLDNSLPPLPNPVQVLNKLKSGDHVKLKAYKQLVAVLKAKLKKAEKQSVGHQEKIQTLLVEIDLMKARAESQTDSDKIKLKADDFDSLKCTDADIMKHSEDERLQQELDQWKTVAESNEQKLTALEAEFGQLKKLQRLEIDKLKRSRMADRMLHTRKLKEASERIKALMDANERLRNTTNKLQVKLTNYSQQLEISRREKLRYQHRARRLQSDLRSLSWIATPSTEKMCSGSGGDAASSINQQSERRLSSVGEVDDLLKNLRSEISLLEQQLANHSSAVNQSKVVLKELRLTEKSANTKSESRALAGVEGGGGDDATIRTSLKRDSLTASGVEIV